MEKRIRVAVLEDHQGIVDGYYYRLSGNPEIEIVGTAAYAAELETMLETQPVDVLLLDINVPTSPDNLNPYPVLHLVPKLVQAYPAMAILAISMHTERSMIRAMMDAGVSGYLIKDDRASIMELGAIVVSVASGGIYLSHQASRLLARHWVNNDDQLLTPRQLEALSLSAAYPNWSTAELADKMGVTNSTVRNLLSGAYLRLEVRNRAAAIAKARQLGLIAPTLPASHTPD